MILKSQQNRIELVTRPDPIVVLSFDPELVAGSRDEVVDHRLRGLLGSLGLKFHVQSRTNTMGIERFRSL